MGYHIKENKILKIFLLVYMITSIGNSVNIPTQTF